MQLAKQSNHTGPDARATEGVKTPRRVKGENPRGRGHRFASELADTRVGEKSRLMFAVDDPYYDAP